MTLSIVVILLIGLIAYIHYVQGLLNGVISAVLAVVAAMMAISFYEPMAKAMSGGKFSDQAQGICLIAIFAATYLIGRVIFDMVIPGNVRLPHLADSIGGAIGGLIAGVFAMGIIVIAFQSMPLGPSILGYARYELVDKQEVTIPGEYNRQINRTVYDQLKNDDLEKGQQGLLLPVDDIVLSFAKRLSSSGSLAGERPLESVHPDLLQEFFGQRIGLEPQAKHTAFSKSGDVVEVKKATILFPQQLEKAAAEFAGIRKEPAKGEKLTPAPGKKLVAVTVMFKADATDEDKLTRTSTGGVRIVTKTTDPSTGKDAWKNNYPIGTVQPVGGTWKAWLNKPDDFLFIDTRKNDAGAHFLFELDDSTFVQAPDAKPVAPAAGAKAGGAPAADAFQFAPDTFIEVKRLEKLPLDNLRVTVGLPPTGAQYYPIRKKELYKEEPAVANASGATPPPAPQGGTPAPAANPGVPSEQNGWLNSPLTEPKLTAGNKLPYPIGVGTSEAEGDVATPAITGHLTKSKFDSIETDLSSNDSAIAAIAKAAPTVQELFVPDGKRMVQVTFKNKGGSPWQWVNIIENFQVYTASTSANHTCYGAYGTFKNGPLDKLFLVYKADARMPNRLAATPDGKLDSVTLIYLIPADQKANEARYGDKRVGLPLGE